MKIYLNKKAQKMLFGYYEGVDWAESLTKDNPNPKNIPIDLYLPLSDKEKEQLMGALEDAATGLQKRSDEINVDIKKVSN